MKNYLLALVVTSSLLLSLIGCQDNSINNPVSSESTNKASPPGVNILRGSIILEHKLVDLVRINNYYFVSGKLITLKNQNENLSATMPGYDVKLNISLDAILKEIFTNLDPNSWNIRSNSVDHFYLNTRGSYTLVKIYPIDGAPNRIELVCTFEATTQGLKLESVVLSSPVV
jgi:hypothetical protein